MESAPSKETSNAASQKRKEPQSNKPHTTITIRRSPWTYLHLELRTTPPSTLLVDALTVRTYLTSALNQFLGITGTAVPIDILKLNGREVWLRVPNGDGTIVSNAVSGWIGGSETEAVAWRVKGMGDWLGAVQAGNGKNLFND
ncbi:hypothetical protein MMC20_004822 [Loxospora ochrophaea]|nr:hypothetical protein [Loxospora ochrophaea]